LTGSDCCCQALPHICRLREYLAVPDEDSRKLAFDKHIRRLKVGDCPPILRHRVTALRRTSCEIVTHPITALGPAVRIQRAVAVRSASPANPMASHPPSLILCKAEVATDTRGAKRERSRDRSGRPASKREREEHGDEDGRRRSTSGRTDRGPGQREAKVRRVVSVCHSAHVERGAQRPRPGDGEQEEGEI
jgi:hypothetical protein